MRNKQKALIVFMTVFMTLFSFKAVHGLADPCTCQNNPNPEIMLTDALIDVSDGMIPGDWNINPGMQVEIQNGEAVLSPSPGNGYGGVDFLNNAPAIEYDFKIEDVSFDDTFMAIKLFHLSRFIDSNSNHIRIEAFVHFVSPTDAAFWFLVFRDGFYYCQQQIASFNLGQVYNTRIQWVDNQVSFYLDGELKATYCFTEDLDPNPFPYSNLYYVTDGTANFKMTIDNIAYKEFLGNIGSMYIQHRIYENGEEFNRLQFSLRDKFNNRIKENILESAVLYDSEDNIIPLTFHMFDTSNYLRGNYDSDTGQWNYNQDFILYYLYYFNFSEPFELPPGTYRLVVTTEDFGTATRYYNYGGKVDLPIVPSQSIKAKIDDSGNLILKWDVPNYVDPNLSTIARVHIYSWLNDEYNGKAMIVNIPTHMGYLFVPQSILNILKTEGDILKLSIVIQTTDWYNRTYSNRVPLDQATGPPGGEVCPQPNADLNTKKLEIKERKHDVKLKIDGSMDLPELDVSDGDIVESRITVELFGVLPDGSDLVISSDDTLEVKYKKHFKIKKLKLNDLKDEDDDSDDEDDEDDEGRDD